MCFIMTTLMWRQLLVSPLIISTLISQKLHSDFIGKSFHLLVLLTEFAFTLKCIVQLMVYNLKRMFHVFFHVNQFTELWKSEAKQSRLFTIFLERSSLVTLQQNRAMK